MYEKDNTYILQVPLPGARPDQLNITAPEGARALVQGAGGGQYREQVVLPGDVAAEHADAQYQDGVLTLTLPKAEHAKERTITLSAGQGRSQSQGQGQNFEQAAPPTRRNDVPWCLTAVVASCDRLDPTGGQCIAIQSLCTPPRRR